MVQHTAPGLVASNGESGAPASPASRPQLRIVFATDAAGKQYPVFEVRSREGAWERALAVHDPAHLGLLYGIDPYIVLRGGYDSVRSEGDSFACTTELGMPDGARFRVDDTWSVTGDNSAQVARVVEMLAAGECRGFRSTLMVETTLAEGADVRDFEYLAPSAFYRHLDLDGDGVPNNYQTHNIAWSEDKLSIPAVMAFHPQRRFLAGLYRVDTAEYDSDVLAKAWGGERFFTLDTDLGSLGFKFVEERRPTQVMLRAYYPFYEGEISFAYDRKGYPWGVFKEPQVGARLEHTHGIVVDEAANFADACWRITSHMLDVYEPERVQLKYSMDEVNRHRLNFLNSCFYQFDESQDPNHPAGYIVNQHPLEGRTLAHVYEYGFTGLQLRNAYNSMRYGYEHDIPEFVENALETIRFFREKVVLENGFCHAAYSADRHCFVSWYQGLLLPYSFATTREEQEQYLGKETVAGLSTINAELKRIEGSYTLPMSEEAYCLLICLELERERGNDHPEWLETARRIADFFLRIQNADGSWYRAVDLEGRPVRVPESWFGRSEDMLKSTTYNTLPLLVKLHELTGERHYLDAAKRGGDFTIERYVDTSYIYGSILDHSFDQMRATGPGMDNSAPMLAMEALLNLYEATKEEKYLRGAVDAAKISATWINLWDVPFPEGTTLHRYGFRSTGWSPAFTMVTSWTTDMSPLLFARDFVKIAELTGDPKFARIAELFLYAMNDMVSTPAETYGYAHHGLQTEGRVMTWYLINDWGKPQEGAEGHEFGGRRKGEENKTAYPWIYAVALGGYYRMIDEYGTVDFDAIRARLQAPATP